MIKRTIVLVLSVLATINSVEAQVRPGVKAGYNLSNVFAKDAKTGDKYSYNMKSGFQFGAFVDYSLGERLSIQPGAQFATQGFVDKYTDNGSFIRKFSLYYLQIPVNVQYKLPLGGIDMVFQAGPYFGYGLSGRQKVWKNDVKQELSDERKKISIGGNSSDNLQNAIDYGIGAAVGIEFVNIQFLVGYNVGLHDLTFKKSTGKAYNNDMKNNGLTFTAAYVFGKKRTKSE